MVSLPMEVEPTERDALQAVLYYPRLFGYQHAKLVEQYFPLQTELGFGIGRNYSIVSIRNQFVLVFRSVDAGPNILCEPDVDKTVVNASGRLSARVSLFHCSYISLSC